MVAYLTSGLWASLLVGIFSFSLFGEYINVFIVIVVDIMFFLSFISIVIVGLLPRCFYIEWLF